MAKQSDKTPMTLTACRMLLWPDGNIQKSTYENPDHDFCPPGEASWFGFQRDMARGTSDYTHDHLIILIREEAEIFRVFLTLTELCNLPL